MEQFNFSLEQSEIILKNKMLFYDNLDKCYCKQSYPEYQNFFDIIEILTENDLMDPYNFVISYRDINNKENVINLFKNCKNIKTDEIYQIAIKSSNNLLLKTFS